MKFSVVLEHINLLSVHKKSSNKVERVESMFCDKNIYIYVFVYIFLHCECLVCLFETMFALCLVIHNFTVCVS